MSEAPPSVKMPENAYRELQPGEVYAPIVPAGTSLPEVTARSVAFGLAMVVVFSAAAAYISLKLGQGIESAIPIAILAIGFSAVLARRSTLLENLNIVALGATAGIVVGGTTFVMPALFILKLEGGLSPLDLFLRIFLVPLFGAVLGVLFLIPFRRYFVSEMHGRLPFPEGTAVTEILVTGERGGRQARVLLSSMGIGFAMDFLALHFRLWRDTFTTALLDAARPLTEGVKAVFALGTSAAVLGLGYITGVRYAAIICAGSFLSTFVLVPLFGRLGTGSTAALFPGRPPLAGLGYEDLFYEHVRYIGIGGIFAAGVISILRMSPVIVQALSRVLTEVTRLGKRGHGAEDVRTERDMDLGLVVAAMVGVSALLWVYFRFSVLAGIPGATTLSFVALGLALGVSFLFAAVSAWAVAMISITPVSGMTLTALIVSSVVLVRLGLSGSAGAMAALLIGGVVCTALSTTGSMVTILKSGYWIGATPKRLEWSLIGGSVLASLTVTGVLLLFHHVYGYGPKPGALPAPQASAMAAVLQSVMASAAAPWFLYGLGAMIAVLVELIGVSGLAFALGMYLPIELNTPLLAGALVAWFVGRGKADVSILRARMNRGTLIASGFIAGGALAGVVDAVVRGIAASRGLEELWWEAGFVGPGGNVAGLLVFLGLCAWIWLDSRRASAEEGAGPMISM
ncbi:MAG TPA: oligopeptide transporter, OPT family [Candidatus Polarisedimenticolaceae bacterium]|nr:oligopeptide transporter, OPT family [Candidatus Polarisedimenticolaceae bacterium]